MRRHSRLAFTALLATTVVASTVAVVGAQDEDEERFSARFWQYLQDAKYENWAAYPGQDPGFVEGQAPHGAFLKLYVNRKAAAQPDNPPPGSIIIKENYGEDQEKLMAVTIMYRLEREYDPQHNNWWWVKYTPDGKVATMDDMRLAGKVQGCINCHSGAKGEDFIFVNDSTE